jgi:hypothetical protein
MYFSHYPLGDSAVNTPVFETMSGDVIAAISGNYVEPLWNSAKPV